MFTVALIAGLVGALLLASRTKPAVGPRETGYGGQPPALLTDTWELAAGGLVVAFRQELVDSIMAGLVYSQTASVPMSGMPAGKAFSIVALEKGSPVNARDALLAIVEVGGAVIGNMALVDPKATGRLLVPVPVADLGKFAAPGSGWAVLLAPAGTLKRKVGEVPPMGVEDKPFVPLEDKDEVKPVVVDEPPVPPGALATLPGPKWSGARSLPKLKIDPAIPAFPWVRAAKQAVSGDWAINQEAGVGRAVPQVGAGPLVVRRRDADMIPSPRGWTGKVGGDWVDAVDPSNRLPASAKRGW